MFLAQLNASQKQAFLSIAKQIIMADDVLDTTEQVLFDTMCAEMRIAVTLDEIPAEIDFVALPQTFEAQALRHQVLLEVLSLAHADGVYQEEEQVLVQKLAEVLNISVEKVTALEAWLKRYLAACQEVQQLCAA